MRLLIKILLFVMLGVLGVLGVQAQPFNAHGSSVAQTVPTQVSVYGAVSDGVLLRDAAITSGTNALSSASATFTSADIGKALYVRGAGAANARTEDLWLVNGSITSGQAILTCPTATFINAAWPAGNIGSTVVILNAGGGGLPLQTTIASYNSATSVNLAATASSTVSGGTFNYQQFITGDLKTTISGFTDAHHVTLAANAGTTVTSTGTFGYGTFFGYGTDNTAAFQNAINAASAKGGTVFIPAGTYYQASTCTLKSGVSITGITSAAPSSGLDNTVAQDWDTPSNYKFALAGNGGSVIIGPSDLECFTYSIAKTGSNTFCTGINISDLGADGVQSLVRVGAVDQYGSAWMTLDRLIVENNYGGFAFSIINSQHVSIRNLRGLGLGGGGLAIKTLYSNPSSAISESSGNRPIFDVMFSQGADIQTNTSFPGVLCLANGNQVASPEFYHVQVNRQVNADTINSATPDMWLLGTNDSSGNSLVVGALLSGVDLEGTSANFLRVENLVHGSIYLDNLGQSGHDDVYLRNVGANWFSTSSIQINYDGAGNNFMSGFLAVWSNLSMPGMYVLGNGNAPRVAGGGNAGYAALQLSYGTLDLTTPTGIYGPSVANGIGIKYRAGTVSSAQSLQLYDMADITCTGTSSYTLTLPTPSGVSGMDVRFYKTAAGGTVTLSTPSGVIGYGGASTSTYLDTQGKSITLHSDGTNYAIVSQPAIYVAGRVTAQSAANASISTYTVGSADRSFEVSANMNVTASTTLVTTLTCTYTDESNTARTMILPVQQLSGSFIAAGAITGTGAWETPVMHIRCKASTAITILTSAGTFTGVTYTAEGVIRQIN